MKRIVKEFDEKFYVKSRSRIYKFDCEPEIMLIGQENIEQITFEQAFAEWNERPVAFISIGNEVNYVVNGWLVGVYSWTEYPPEKLSKNRLIDAIYPYCKVFQAESIEDLHLNVIPTLIRMAREGL